MQKDISLFTEHLFNVKLYKMIMLLYSSVSKPMDQVGNTLLLGLCIRHLMYQTCMLKFITNKLKVMK